MGAMNRTHNDWKSSFSIPLHSSNSHVCPFSSKGTKDLCELVRLILRPNGGEDIEKVE